MQLPHVLLRVHVGTGRLRFEPASALCLEQFEGELSSTVISRKGTCVRLERRDDQPAYSSGGSGGHHQYPYVPDRDIYLSLIAVEEHRIGRR